MEGVDIFTQRRERITNTREWTTQEHILFMDRLKLFGPDWAMIADDLGSRSPFQVQ